MAAPAAGEYGYQIDSDNRIVHISDAFRAFARDNGTPALADDVILGQSIFTFITGEETRHLYGVLFETVRDGTTPVTVPFRCDSPSLRRFMQLTLTSAERGGIALTGRLLRTEPRAALPLLDPSMPRSDQLLRMCSFCKRAWIEDEGWVTTEQAILRLNLFGTDRLPGLTHGVCDACLPAFRRMCGLPE